MTLQSRRNLLVSASAFMLTASSVRAGEKSPATVDSVDAIKALDIEASSSGTAIDRPRTLVEKVEEGLIAVAPTMDYEKLISHGILNDDVIGVVYFSQDARLPSGFHLKAGAYTLRVHGKVASQSVAVTFMRNGAALKSESMPVHRPAMKKSENSGFIPVQADACRTRCYGFLYYCPVVYGGGWCSGRVYFCGLCFGFSF
jgi:hypothetical protein